MLRLKFKSRYGDERELVEDQPGEFTFSGFSKIKYLRVGEAENGDGYNFIDADGGPFLQVGAKLIENIVIEKIIFNDGRYKILTKDISNERINNEKPQDPVPSGEQSSDD
jgi:hypothetical protein